MQFPQLVRIATASLLIIATAASIVAAQQPPPAEGTEADLIAVLQSADAPLFDKAKACQQLAVIGTKECVPALAGLLGDEKLSHYARYGLEPLPDPSVDEALRTALGDLDGGLLVGVINTIGMRQDEEAVDALKQLMDDSDARVAGAAAGSLGQIHTPDAIAALKAALDGSEPLRTAAGDAALTAVDMLIAEGNGAEAAAICDALRKADVADHIHIAALHGAIRALGDDGLPRLAECLQSDNRDVFRVGLGMANEIGGPEAASMLSDALELPSDGDSHPRAALLIYALGDLGERTALPIVLKAARNAAPDVRQAAIRALGLLGDASAVEVLLAAAVDDEALSSAARESLADLEGEEVDAAIAKAFETAEGKKRLVLIGLIGDRGIAAAVPALKQAAGDEDLEVATAAIKALSTTIELDELSVLIDLLVSSASAEKSTAAKEALKIAVLRMPDRDATSVKLLAPMDGASATGKVNLLDLLGIVGGEKALKGVAAAARSGDDAAQDAATRVLGGWMSPDAAPVLLELAKAGPEKFRIRCLRGFIRIPRQFDVSLQGRIAMCRDAMAAATRDAEKALVLEVLGRNPSPETLAEVAPYLDDEALHAAASAAAVAIAEKLIDQHPGPVAEVLQKAVEAEDEEVAGKARRLLRRAKNE
jgi:HEAT repeat protein